MTGIQPVIRLSNTAAVAEAQWTSLANVADQALLGRRSECDALDRVVDDVQGGHSSVLVLRGEAGIGKSALLQHLHHRACKCRVETASGTESEMELPFAGLHQLCAPMVDHLDGLPEPQRRALATILGIESSPPPDQFLVGLAVLGLLSAVAEDRPLVCIIDDGQWLDRATASTLAFVARRLLAEPVAVVFASRDRLEDGALSGLPALTIGGLPNSDAHALLLRGLRAPMDPAVVDRIVAETGGNPLALLELPRVMTLAELAGGFGLPGTMTVPNRIEAGFLQRISELPRATQRLLLIAAAEPIGDPVVVWKAAASLGIEAEAALPASDDGLLQLDARVVFRHPLVRSAAYRRATTSERQEAHRALADATDVVNKPDRRAWHRALATTGPDEDVAEELVRSAGRAQARGGMAAAAALLERAANLTLDSAMRGQRTVAAAAAHLEAGAFEAANTLLSACAAAGQLDEGSAALVELIRGYGQLVWGDTRLATNTLVRAARGLEQTDVRMARRAYLDAINAGVAAGPLARGADLREAAESAREAPASPGRERPQDVLMDGYALEVTAGPAAAAPVLRRAVEAYLDGGSVEDRIRGLGEGAASLTWDHDGWHELASRHVEALREMGGLTMLPWALISLACSEVFAGNLSTAATLVGEASAVIEAMDSRIAPHAAALLAGWRGDAEAENVIDAVIAQGLSHGQGLAVRISQNARATFYNSLGRYDRAFATAREANEDPIHWGSNLTLHELIEAASRLDEQAVAEDALRRLEESAQASGTDWGLGVEARSRALITRGAGAEALYREAVERLDRSPVRAEAARAHLLYGEWLRREQRRVDARDELRRAHEMFTDMGAEAFAERTRRELLATGQKVRSRSVDLSDALTPQESQIARFAADGESNPEIGSRLFISPRTVEYHLSKVFVKLGVKSRRELRDVIRSRP